jgi:hypothetical protein
MMLHTRHVTCACWTTLPLLFRWRVSLTAAPSAASMCPSHTRAMRSAASNGRTMITRRCKNAHAAKHRTHKLRWRNAYISCSHTQNLYQLLQLSIIGLPPPPTARLPLPIRLPYAARRAHCCSHDDRTHKGPPAALPTAPHQDYTLPLLPSQPPRSSRRPDSQSVSSCRSSSPIPPSSRCVCSLFAHLFPPVAPLHLRTHAHRRSCS